MSKDKKETYKAVCSEYRFTIENQLDAHDRLRQRNTDLAKINLLGIGTLLAGVSITDLEVTLVFLALTVSVSCSLFYSARILRHRSLTRGFGSSFHESIEEDVEENNKERWEIYKKIGKTYSESVDSIGEEFEQIEILYQRALWASVASFVFLVVYILLFSISVDYDVGFELPLLFLIPILTLATKDMMEDSE